MKVELSPEEAELIQFAIVSTDELWKTDEKVKGRYEPKNELVLRVLNKIITVLEGGDP